MIKLLAVLAFFLLVPAAGAEVTTSGSDKIDEIAAGYISGDVPGAVVAVVRAGKIVHLKGYGLANLKNKDGWTERTLQDLASCSKAFTAFAALMLVERGKLKLDDDIRTYLPDFPEKSKQRPIRVQDVLHMIAGLPAYEDEVDDAASIEDNAAAIKSIQDKKLEYPTGSKHEYSNTSYAMMALIIARAAGQPFPRFMQKEIFEPLGMSTTFILEAPGALQAGRAVPYAKKKGKWKDVRDDTHVFGDGQVVTCGADLTRWALQLDHPTLIKRETLEIAFAPGKFDSGEDSEYGMGWFPDTNHGKREVWHTGSWGGVASYVGHYPDDHLTVMVVSNDEDMDCSGLGGDIEDLMLARAKRAAKRKIKKKAKKSEE